MKPLHVIVAMIWILVLVAAHELFSPTPVITHVLEAEPDTTSVSDSPRVDLYGNEVHPAVGDYRVDHRGELYERHAPDTAVLRLGPPGT